MEEQTLILIIWSTGLLVAVAAPLILFIFTRKKWRKLPNLDVEMVGRGPPIEEVEKAILYFASLWPDEVDFSGLKIEWVPGEFFNTGRGRAVGQTNNRTYIKLAFGGGFRVLFHELAHVAMYQAHDDPDRNHINQKLWDLMYEIQVGWEHLNQPDVLRWADNPDTQQDLPR